MGRGRKRLSDTMTIDQHFAPVSGYLTLPPKCFVYVFTQFSIVKFDKTYISNFSGKEILSSSKFVKMWTILVVIDETRKISSFPHPTIAAF